MTEQERIRRLYTWMGWSIPQGFSTYFKGSDRVDIEGWNPLTDLNHARMLEDEVERRGLKDAYGMHLVYLLFNENVHYSAFDIAHATPEQCCRAVEKLMEGETK